MCVCGRELSVLLLQFYVLHGSIKGCEKVYLLEQLRISATTVLDWSEPLSQVQIIGDTSEELTIPQSQVLPEKVLKHSSLYRIVERKSDYCELARVVWWWWGRVGLIDIFN